MWLSRCVCVHARCQKLIAQLAAVKLVLALHYCIRGISSLCGGEQINGAISRASLAASQAADAEMMSRIRLRTYARQFC